MQSRLRDSFFHFGGDSLIKTLAKCVREYKASAILSPILVSLEVVCECLIPFFIVELGNSFLANEAAYGSLTNILMWGGILVAVSLASLLFGALAGAFCAKASAGFAKNLRQDLYYKVQEFSFENIDKV